MDCESFAEVAAFKVGSPTGLLFWWGLRSPGGTRPVVTLVEHYHQVQPVYDLTVEGIGPDSGHCEGRAP